MTHHATNRKAVIAEPQQDRRGAVATAKDGVQSRSGTLRGAPMDVAFARNRDRNGRGFRAGVATGRQAIVATMPALGAK